MAYANRKDTDEPAHPRSQITSFPFAYTNAYERLEGLSHSLRCIFLSLLGYVGQLILRQTKIAADDTLFFYFYLSKKIRLDFFM